jgi:hypothetical protein
VLRTSSFVANDASTEALKRALREFAYAKGLKKVTIPQSVLLRADEVVR